MSFLPNQRRSLLYYKSAYLGNIGKASYLFNVDLIHAHFAFFSSDRNETKILKIPF